MTDAPRVLEVIVPVGSAELATHVAAALSVETHDLPARTNVEVTARGGDVFLRITSQETRTLRAAAHSFLRWADVAIATARVAGG